MELVLVKDKINKILAVAVLAGIIICNICSVWCTVCWCVATRNLVALHVCMAAQQQNSSHMSLFSPKGCNLKLCMSTSCPTIPPSESFTPKIPHFVSPCHWTSFPNQKPTHTHTDTIHISHHGKSQKTSQKTIRVDTHQLRTSSLNLISLFGSERWRIQEMSRVTLAVGLAGSHG